jgi:hypothetical protein
MPVKINLKTKIIYQGKEYATPEELPPEARQAYEQALAGQGTSPQVKVTTNGSKITLNGQTYNSLDEMPEEARRIYESVMAEVDKNQDGIPDALQTSGQASFPVAGSPAPSAPLIPQANVISPANTNKRLLVVSGVVILILFLIAALILILLSRGG